MVLGEQKKVKPLTKGKAQLQDDSIQGTNSSSIVSKRSVERLYFPNETHYFRYFVKKPQRRAPLINRGYWLRMKCIDSVVKTFLEAPSTKQKVVINLGCGYDPLPWQSLERYPLTSKNAKFIDIDYRDLMLKKRDVVLATEELYSVFKNASSLIEGDILFRSDGYVQLGVDLRNLSHLGQVLASVIDIDNSTILFTAEVSITYMSLDTSDALIKWASILPEAQFCLLEQLLPAGLDHPFAKTMMMHFDKLKTSLGAVQTYPTTHAQESRFRSLGWTHALARNLWELWSAPDFLSQEERLSLDDIEPFDEWEEFAIFGCHYFLLVASNNKTSPPVSSKKAMQTSPTEVVELSLAYSADCKDQEARRFGAALHYKDSINTAEGIANFGGMGMTSRMSSYDLYSTRLTQPVAGDNKPQIGPSARMCHTITDMGEAGALLVGGRTGPDNALADCWIYHKWLGMWERVEDIPGPVYRHSAVYFGNGCVLVSPGRTNSRETSTTFYIWSRKSSWRKCICTRQPSVTFGSTFFVTNDTTSSTVSCGILAGGISQDALIVEDIWEWEISGFSSHEPSLTFTPSLETYSLLSPIARFGAAVTTSNTHVFVVGGIVKNDMLQNSNELCVFPINQSSAENNPDFKVTAWPASRPLLVGSSIKYVNGSLIIMGGSAVCFSFGTFWNRGCFTLDIPQNRTERSLWKFIETMNIGSPRNAQKQIPTQNLVEHDTVIVSRIKLQSENNFTSLLGASKPVILEDLNLGDCTDKWSTDYLKQQIGAGRQIVVHEATSENMDFQTKNFAYITKSFGEFIDQAESGGKLYLRSLSAEKPSELPANINTDFSNIAPDFRLPSELAVVQENFHSSPLRISGPVNMWLHYDVMANVLCQIRGTKRLLLFPPADISHFQFLAGASSSSNNVFACAVPGSHPHEVILKPGDVLFIPPLWLHSASPTSGLSIAVNVFFRNLPAAGYSAGKDVYGNRDLQRYEKGRQDLAKLIKSFDSLPNDTRDFYLRRLAQELDQAIS